MKKYVNDFFSIVVFATTVFCPRQGFTQTVDVNDIAKQVTVKVDSSNPGSGVIVWRQAKNYFVLTARHVVEEDAGKKIIIHTFDGSSQSAEIRKLPGEIDLAILEFSSDRTYQYATTGSPKQGTTVTVAGFPRGGLRVQSRELMFTSGTISTGFIVPTSAEGYNLGYSNKTRAGMSGGPILNSSGQLVGIHCTAEGETEKVRTQDWVNYGISSKSFVDALQDIGINLASSGSSKEPLTNPAIPDPGSFPQNITVCKDSQKFVCSVDHDSTVNIK